MLRNHPSHGRSWIFPQPSLPDAEPEEADHTFEFLLAGEFLLLPGLPPLCKIAGIEFSQESDAPFLSESEELHLEEAPQLLPRSRCQAAGLSIAEEDTDRLLDCSQLGRFYVVFAAESGLLVFASEEFGLLPGFGFCRGAESASAAGKSPVKPLWTAATAVVGIVFLRAIGVMAGVDGQHNAVNLARKIGWYKSGTVSKISYFSTIYMIESIALSYWWRRRESNPRPKSLSARRIHAQSSSGGFTRCAQNGQDAQKASPMILWLQHGPSRSHQPTE